MTYTNLQLSIFQIDLAYKDKQKNLSNIDSLANNITNTDIILLPEMFNTSFITNDTSLAEADVLERTNIVLEAGRSIVVTSSDGTGVAVNVYGVEEDV